jgi:hypothetical protein
VGPGDRVPHRPRPAGPPTISQGNRARAAAAELAVSGLIGVRGIKDEIDISYDAVAPVDVTALVLLRARAIAGQPIEDSILLCARLPVTVEDRDRAARLGFDLAAPYCPFTAQLAGASALGHADLASRLRAAGALAFTEGVRVTGLAPPRFSWKAFIDDPRLLLAQDPPTARTQLAAAADQLRADRDRGPVRAPGPGTRRGVPARAAARRRAGDRRPDRGAPQHPAVPGRPDREADQPVAQGPAGPDARSPGRHLGGNRRRRAAGRRGTRRSRVLDAAESTRARGGRISKFRSCVHPRAQGQMTSNGTGSRVRPQR